MPELALHILDLVQNSVSAGATRVVVTICYDTASDTLLISIEDDGKGIWRQTLPELTGNWKTDLLAVARSQLGYMYDLLHGKPQLYVRVLKLGGLS